MKIEVAHEATVNLFKSVRSLTDYDFGIASYVLSSETYARLCCTRGEDRMLILDNGAFELGEPLLFEDLERAARLAKPDYTIAPDYFGDMARTLQAVSDFCERWVLSKVGAAVVGLTPELQITCYDQIRKNPGVEMICWVFGHPRAEALTQLKAISQAHKHHLFGFNTIKELKSCLKEFARLGVKEVSLDTSKPISAAFGGEVLENKGRGAYRRPLVEDHVSPSLATYNMGIFRGWIQTLGEENG